MARSVDYVAPMVYPSHWGPGEYGVADPNGQPYEIVRALAAGLRSAGARHRRTRRPVAPGLLLGGDYGPAEVRAQIKGARDAGVDEFLLWDAAVSVHARTRSMRTAEVPALGSDDVAAEGRAAVRCGWPIGRRRQPAQRLATPTRNPCVSRCRVWPRTSSGRSRW